MWTEEEFQAWKGSPRTAEFLHFLAEVRDEMKARWADGEDMTPREQAMTQTYGDIIGLNYGETVKPFYVAAGLVVEKDETEEEESDDVSE